MTYGVIRRRSVLGFVCFLLCNVCLGDTYEPKTDNRIICLDVETGRLVWEHIPKKLSDAHFEWYEKGVVVYPHYDGTNRSEPLFLNVNTGKAIKAFSRDPKNLLAHSAVFWPGPEIALENDWRLTGFSPGNTKSLVFHDARDKETWKIETGGYPHQVRSWKNFVFYAFSYLSDEGILYAYRAGMDRPTWTIDLNTTVKGRSPPLTRMIFQVIEDNIYVEANEHIFCIHPQSGKLLWHRDFAEDLRLRFRPDFYGGALNLAVFAKSGNVLVVSFERRVIALNLETGEYLWHLQPDTFPHCPFPVIQDRRIILSAGAKRTLTRLHVDKPK